jgi:SsrA-binding protein
MRVVATNKKAYRDFEILETYEAGIELKGTEVKSVREGRVNLRDSYVRAKDGELFLVNAHISPYEKGNLFNHDPKRDRKLLLHRREINRIIGRIQERGLTAIPLKMYINKRGLVKVEIALAKGRKLYEKKQKLKEKAIEREAMAELKRYRF